jgi:hypothetical protein
VAKVPAKVGQPHPADVVVVLRERCGEQPEQCLRRLVVDR